MGRRYPRGWSGSGVPRGVTVLGSCLRVPSGLMDEARTYHIGELAARVHLSLRTLRYWEEVGLITPSGRTDGGFRLYTEANAQRVELIKCMKPIDLSLAELRSLADDRDRLADPACPPQEREAAIGRIEPFLDRIRNRLEILRGRIEEAESAALELEHLIIDGSVPS